MYLGFTKMSFFFYNLTKSCSIS